MQNRLWRRFCRWFRFRFWFSASLISLLTNMIYFLCRIPIHDARQTHPNSVGPKNGAAIAATKARKKNSVLRSPLPPSDIYSNSAISWWELPVLQFFALSVVEWRRKGTETVTGSFMSVGTVEPFHGRDGRVLRPVLPTKKFSTERDGYPCHGCRGTVPTATGGSPKGGCF
ncbi:hypothetical protein C8J57DRAFT_1243804 [Mycena rebaudengoi]|nr:hypothetical protein C8J57DRAFT_1243804 [Mycena rebaudengoi]